MKSCNSIEDWIDGRCSPLSLMRTRLVIPICSVQDVLHFFLQANTVFVSDGETRQKKTSMKDSFTLGRGGINMIIVVLHILRLEIASNRVRQSEGYWEMQSRMFLCNRIIFGPRQSAAPRGSTRHCRFNQLLFRSSTTAYFLQVLSYVGKSMGFTLESRECVSPRSQVIRPPPFYTWSSCPL